MKKEETHNERLKETWNRSLEYLSLKKTFWETQTKLDTVTYL